MTANVVLTTVRHHTRFYPREPKDMDQKTGNCMPGTTVDQGITSVYDFDCYIQPHAALQGSVRPTHYTVIHDTIGWSADDMMQLVSSCV